MDRIKVLLVDDEPDLLLVIGKTIETWGYEVFTVASGKEAIEAVREKKADMIVLDYQMPEMDGLTALRQIREIDPQIPVVMFTAHQDGIPLKNIHELKISACVPKTSTEFMLKAALVSAQERIEKKTQ
ncbi:MAG: response regulator [Candidatus Omnitrophica bacterium]|nr:response regulator [Candidatus Omnitrophota bacterium]